MSMQGFPEKAALAISESLIVAPREKLIK